MEGKIRRYFHVQGFLSSMFSFIITGFVLNAFLLRIGFRDFELGIYGSLMHLGFVFTLLGAHTSRKTSSRKMFYMRFYMITVVMMVIFIFLPYILKGNELIITVIIVLFLINASSSFAWSVLIPFMHDMVHKNVWDRFYARRMSIMSLPGLLSLAFGNILEGKNVPVFTSIFVFALLCIFLTIIVMLLVPDDKKKVIDQNLPKNKKQESLFKIITLKREYKFIYLYGFLLSFFTGLFYPLKYKYMIDHLGIDLRRLSVYEFIGIIVTIFSFALWGRLSKEKNRLIIILALGLIKAFEPAIWLLTENNTVMLYFIYVLFGAGEGSGIIGTGLWMVMMNYLLSHTDIENKTIAFNYSIAFKSCAFIVSSLAGGYLSGMLQSKKSFQIIGFANIEVIIALSMIFSIIAATYLIFSYRKLKAP